MRVQIVDDEAGVRDLLSRHSTVVDGSKCRRRGAADVGNACCCRRRWHARALTNTRLTPRRVPSLRRRFPRLGTMGLRPLDPPVPNCSTGAVQRRTFWRWGAPTVACPDAFELPARMGNASFCALRRASSPPAGGPFEDARA